MADETITTQTTGTSTTTGAMTIDPVTVANALSATATNTPTIAEPPTESEEVAKLKAELAKLKSSNDKLAKENADKTKQIRAKQSAEEAAAEEAKERQEAQAKELAELRKKFAVAETSKKVMGFISDENVSNQVAEYLYGAEDVDAALAAINKAWTAKEKALRLEFGKIPAPSVGSSDGLTLTKEQLDAMGYMERAKFANEHPVEYNKLMGR